MTENKKNKSVELKTWPDLISLHPRDSVFMPGRRLISGKGIRRVGKTLLRPAHSCLQKQNHSE